MGNESALKPKSPLKAITWVISSLLMGYSGSVFSWCAINEDFGLNTKQCTMSFNYDIDDCEKDPKCEFFEQKMPASCIENENLSFSLKENVVHLRGSDFQSQGTRMFTNLLNLSDASTAARVPLMLLCFGDKKEVKYTWRLPSNKNIIPVSGVNTLSTSNTADAHVGLRLTVGPDSNAATFPDSQQLTGIAEIRNNNFIDGVFIESLGALKVDGYRTNIASSQNIFANNSYAELDIEYFSRDDAASRSKLTLNVFIGDGTLIDRIETCGVYVSNPTVELGMVSTTKLIANQANIVPFEIFFHCDTADNKVVPSAVAFQTKIGTRVVKRTNDTLIADNPENGVGIAFSQSASFDVLEKWMVDRNICSSVEESISGDYNYAFCHSMAGSELSKSDGWINVNAAKGQSKTFYAQMRQINNEPVIAGPVEGSVRVIITHP